MNTEKDMQILNELHDKGLVTDEEYDRKMEEDKKQHEESRQKFRQTLGL